MGGILDMPTQRARHRGRESGINNKNVPGGGPVYNAQETGHKRKQHRHRKRILGPKKSTQDVSKAHLARPCVALVFLRHGYGKKQRLCHKGPGRTRPTLETLLHEYDKTSEKVTSHQKTQADKYVSCFLPSRMPGNAAPGTSAR